MDSVLNISEKEMGMVHYFLGLAMSLMYLIAGPRLTAHFLDNPGIQFTARPGVRKRDRQTESVCVCVCVCVCERERETHVKDRQSERGREGK